MHMLRTCGILVREVQLVEYAIVAFFGRRRPDVVADHLILEVSLPACSAARF